MKCSEMGGPATCDHVITGATAEEMATNGMNHVTEAHPELAETIKANSKEENDKWMEELKGKFETLPVAETPTEEEAA